MTRPELRVELNVFSGRTNPSWVLEPDEVGYLTERVGRMFPGAAPAPAKLGYRGFTVYRMQGGQVAPWLEVGSGTVRVTEGGRPLLYHDNEKIEEWLRDQAAAHGFGGLVSAKESEEG